MGTHATHTPRRCHWAISAHLTTSRRDERSVEMNGSGGKLACR